MPKPKVRMCKQCGAGIPVYSPYEYCYPCYRKITIPSKRMELKVLKETIVQTKKTTKVKSKIKLKLKSKHK